MRQNLTTFRMKSYVGNYPKKSMLRLCLARGQVCPDILEGIEEDANVLKNMMACNENFIFQHDPEEKRQSMQRKMLSD
jgi:hypothetical protein